VIGARNVRVGLVLLAGGFVSGLAMSLYAFQPLVAVPAGLAHYDDLPRRLFRLAHIAAVMLPLLNVVLGPWLDRVALPRPVRWAASWFLLWGAVGLPATLALEALVPPVIVLHLSAVPAIVFSAGVLLVSVGAFRTDLAKEASHADRHRRGAPDQRDRRPALQEAAGDAR
jgi:hypothetical protein